MANGDIFRAADRFRRELLGREREAARRMVGAYSDAWLDVHEQLEDVLADIEEMQAAGEEVPVEWLFQRDRLPKLQAQIEERLNEFAPVAEGTITDAQAEVVRLAGEHAASTVGLAPIDVSFSRLPDEALQDLVGFLGDGSPLRDLLDELGPEASELARDTMIRGLATGRNPREIARQMRQAFGGNLSRAMRVSRTEILRSYRESTRRHYEANDDIIEGWYWLSARQPGRTCISCWAMDGTFHKNSERLDDHPNGRCAMVPGIKGVDMGVGRGLDVFRELPAEEQLESMDSAKFEAWQAGEVDLEDFVGRNFSQRWGSNRFEDSLKNARRRAAQSEDT